MWEPRFTFHGFRYVEVLGLDAGDTAEVTGIVLHSDTTPTGTFRCSQPLLNQLQHNIVWGQKSNFLEAADRLPASATSGSAGRATRKFSSAPAAFNMDVRGFFHKWMRDARDSQTAEGGIHP